MKRVVEYRPAAIRELQRMDKGDAARIVRAVESLASTARGDVKALKGPLKGRYRLRVGKWRVFFRFEPPHTVLVIDVDNRGEAY